MALIHVVVLDHLAQHREQRRPAEIAWLFHLTRGAIANTLARLEWAGHVHIRPRWDGARRSARRSAPCAWRRAKPPSPPSA